MADDETAVREPLAVALKRSAAHAGYPQVTAQAKGDLAERLLAVAREANVPVEADADLARILHALEPRSVVPPEVVLAVAEVYACLHRLGKLRRDEGRAPFTER